MQRFSHKNLLEIIEPKLYNIRELEREVQSAETPMRLGFKRIVFKLKQSLSLAHTTVDYDRLPINLTKITCGISSLFYRTINHFLLNFMSPHSSMQNSSRGQKDKVHECTKQQVLCIGIEVL